MKFKSNKDIELNKLSIKFLLKKLIFRSFVYLKRLKSNFENIERYVKLTGDSIFLKLNDNNYYLNLKNKLQRNVYIYNNFENHLDDIFYSSIKSNSIVVDVGANVGILSIKFSNFLKKKNENNNNESVVVSFEPSKKTFKELEFNIDLNKDKYHTKIHPFNLGVGMNNETKIFYETHDPDMQHSYSFIKNNLFSKIKDNEIIKYKVNVVSLDNFLLEKYNKEISLIKIDTGGDELDVIKGSKKIINKFGTTLVFEFDRKKLKYIKKDVSEYNFLFDIGYKVFLILENGFLYQINNFKDAENYKGKFDEICCIKFKN